MAFHDWWRRDPEAVEAWLATAPRDAAHDQCRIWQLTARAVADPERLVSDPGPLAAEARQKLLEDWSLKFGTRAESWPAMEALISREGNPDFALRCYRNLAWLMARDASPGDYLAMLRRAQVRESDRPAIAGLMCSNLLPIFAARPALTAEDRAAAREIHEVWRRAAPQEAEAQAATLREAFGETAEPAGP